MTTVAVETWARRSFRLAIVPPDEPVIVDGISNGMFGLHVGITHFVDVTHLGTGLKLGAFRSLGAAMEFVEQIKPLHNWPALLANEIPYPLVVEITKLVADLRASEVHSKGKLP